MSRDGASEVRRGLTALLPRLWRYALVLTRDGPAAEDLVQSTCLRALDKATQYAAQTNLDRWVFTIMSSIWKNSLRSANRLETEPSVDVNALPIAGVDTGELAVFARQVLERVCALPDGQRAVVALACIERWTYRETADALGIPIGTVMSRLATARRSLAILNADDAGEDRSPGAVPP